MVWDYTKKAYKKQAKADPKWHLERMICYGLHGEKLNKKLLEKHFAELKIPKDRKIFLELLLWGKKF